MIEPLEFVKFVMNHGVKCFAGVPDSLLKDFCAAVEQEVSRDFHFTAANEGGAVGFAAGSWLASGKIPLVYLQNSGLGNAVNPLTSLAHPSVYGIPMILLVGWRGEPAISDEPQHKSMGQATEKIVAAMNLPFGILPKNELEWQDFVINALSTAKEEKSPFVVLVKKSTFTTLTPVVLSSEDSRPTREDALSSLIAQLRSDDVIFSSTGKLSRELSESLTGQGAVQPNQVFLNVGAMGHTSQIALGYAQTHKTRRVICLDGDGAVLMHMGSLASIGATGPRNFHHIVFNNRCHESVGGQATSAPNLSLFEVAKSTGYSRVFQIFTSHELNDLKALGEVGPTFTELHIKPGSRDGLGRPSLSPREQLALFSASSGPDLQERSP